MIQIPDIFKPENFVIEPFAQNKNNEITNINPKMKARNYTKKEIRNLFIIEYKNIFKREFIETKESKDLLYTILCYFFKDDRFFNSPCLIIPKGTNPSFDKGLLIMGNCGVGKTSVLLALEQVFNNHLIFNPKTHFKSIQALELVNDFEKLKNAEEREDFFNKHHKGFRFYDDVKSEDDASNFGKVNLVKKILFLRNAKGSKTIISCNYHPSFPNNFEKGLDEFGIRYDQRIYDRLHSDFNFIEARGKSLRG
jgi:hypothetical protein